jgi:hypothetical protein
LGGWRSERAGAGLIQQQYEAADVYTIQMRELNLQGTREV